MKRSLLKNKILTSKGVEINQNKVTQLKVWAGVTIFCRDGISNRRRRKISKDLVGFKYSYICLLMEVQQLNKWSIYVVKILKITRRHISFPDSSYFQVDS